MTQVNTDYPGPSVSTPAFSALRFSSTSGAWVVAAGDIVAERLISHGNGVYTYSIRLMATTITGSPASLLITLPNGLKFAYEAVSMGSGIASIALTAEAVELRSTIATGTINVSRLGGTTWAAGAGVIYLGGEITFQAQ